jgi:hypothetical protein
MQTARFFLISSPPLSLSNVPRHVFAGLRLAAKMAIRSLTFILLLIAKLILRPVPTYLSTLYLFSSTILSPVFLSLILPWAP